MLVDWEKVVHELKAVVESKNSHGQRELREAIAKAEVKYRIEEGLPERALRLYGVALSEDLMFHPDKASASDDRVPVGANGASSQPIEAPDG